VAERHTQPEHLYCRRFSPTGPRRGCRIPELRSAGGLPPDRGAEAADLQAAHYAFAHPPTDAAYLFAGGANASRRPGFLSGDFRFSKGSHVNPKSAMRVSVSVHNLINHFHPQAFRNKTADPACGLCFGQRGRRFPADFDGIC